MSKRTFWTLAKSASSFSLHYNKIQNQRNEGKRKRKSRQTSSTYQPSGKESGIVTFSCVCVYFSKYTNKSNKNIKKKRNNNTLSKKCKEIQKKYNQKTKINKRWECDTCWGNCVTSAAQESTSSTQKTRKAQQICSKWQQKRRKQLFFFRFS